MCGGEGKEISYLGEQRKIFTFNISKFIAGSNEQQQQQQQNAHCSRSTQQNLFCGVVGIFIRTPDLK